MRITILATVLLVVVFAVSPRPCRSPAVEGVNVNELRVPAPTTRMVESMLRQRREGKHVEDFTFTPDERVAQP